MTANAQWLIVAFLTDPNDRETCTVITLANDGHAFREEDWERIMTIAQVSGQHAINDQSNTCPLSYRRGCEQGNPDEEKIGMFGVGFYIVFSATERPTITSAGRFMTFHWR
jgi:hypothetical protein